jgi:hypothetical protein
LSFQSFSLGNAPLLERDDVILEAKFPYENREKVIGMLSLFPFVQTKSSKYVNAMEDNLGAL